jgi:alpha-beta hydrolase superfamily lysophospholipase
MLDENKPIIICFHGYKGNYKDNNFGLKKYAFDNNFNLLLVSQRSHYESEGKSITFGIKERRDVQVWANYISEKYPKNKIILAGTSMGGATVLMASDLTLPRNVVGIIADAPFNSPEEVMHETIRRKKLPVKFVSLFAYYSGVIFGNFNIKYHTSLKSIRKTKLPILIIHGKSDNTICYKLSEEMLKGCIKGGDNLEVYCSGNELHFKHISYVSIVDEHIIRIVNAK